MLFRSDAIHDEDVDEVGVVGDDDSGAAVIDGGELEGTTILTEADTMMVGLGGGQERETRCRRRPNPGAYAW